MFGSIYFAALALVAYALFVVWPTPPCLTGGLLLIAASILGRKAVLCTPVQTSSGLCSFSRGDVAP